MRYLEIYKRQQETAPKTAWVPPTREEPAGSLSQTWVVMFGNKNLKWSGFKGQASVYKPVGDQAGHTDRGQAAPFL